MKKPTSTFALLIVGLCILACNRSDIDQNSSSSDALVSLKIEATNMGSNGMNDPISNGSFSTLTLVTEDDRKL
nr:hypothetical protein [uncultured Allomuricauda sp.]